MVSNEIRSKSFIIMLQTSRIKDNQIYKPHIAATNFSNILRLLVQEMYGNACVTAVIGVSHYFL